MDKKSGVMADETSFSNVRFLTVSEVARVMRVSKMTVYRMIHSSELPAVQFGRSYRVPESAVEEVLKGAQPERRAKTG